MQEEAAVELEHQLKTERIEKDGQALLAREAVERREREEDEKRLREERQQEMEREEERVRAELRKERDEQVERDAERVRQRLVRVALKTTAMIEGSAPSDVERVCFFLFNHHAERGS